MPFTTAICQSILNLYFGKTNSLNVGSTDLYLALCTNDPEVLDSDGNVTFSELSGNNYARVWLATKTPNAEWPVYMAAAGEKPADYVAGSGDISYLRAIQNKKEIHFNKATPNAWATAQGFGVYTDDNNGTLLYYAKLDEPVTCAAEDVVVFDPGDLKISFATEDVAEASTT